MKNILQKIKTSFFKSLKGKENFWIVLFGWGMPIYIIVLSFILPTPSSLALKLFPDKQIFTILWIKSTIYLSYPLSILYPLFFSFLLIRNSIAKNFLYIIISIIIAIIILAYSFVSHSLGMGIILVSISLIKICIIIIPIFFAYLFITIVFKIIKYLSTRNSK